MGYPLLHGSGCGLGYDASGGLGLDGQVGLAGGRHSTSTWFHKEGAHVHYNADSWEALTDIGSTIMNKSSEWRPSPVFEDVICGLGRCAILFFSPV